MDHTLKLRSKITAVVVKRVSKSLTGISEMSQLQTPFRRKYSSAIIPGNV